MKIKNSAVLLLSFLILLSCNNESKSSYKFRFRVTDTVAQYRIFFYTRVLADFKEESLPLSLTILSPYEKRYVDTMSFPLFPKTTYSVTEVAKSGVWKDVRWLYRDGVTFPRKGLWVLTVNFLPPNDSIGNIRDFGIIIKEK